ncbi:MAG: prepilin-type N-terminal cleavage/methylation domain-containing protein [Deltaproteobacteria bacterium]|nr:prepilin-type N-terminal cleavage/methylation domain-containing protein [Deltaproteobacteria bacterium]TLN05149.1 MAG: prepilin-type N-terminal cleavage/methylation domain-containing protein [bacterium]
MALFLLFSRILTLPGGYMGVLSRPDLRCNGTRGLAKCGRGFTLLELLITLTIFIILGAIATPLFASFYGTCCLKAVMWELAGMVREAKQCALSEKYYAISFDPAKGSFSLLSGRGDDGKWNTPDDEVVRTVWLKEKGGGLCFGYGSYGKIPGLGYADSDDGITFPNNNTLICNPDLTGNAGTVYIRSSHGGAMALTMNSTDFGYTLRRWDGSGWVIM